MRCLGQNAILVALRWRGIQSVINVNLNSQFTKTPRLLQRRSRYLPYVYWQVAYAVHIARAWLTGAFLVLAASLHGCCGWAKPLLSLLVGGEQDFLSCVQSGDDITQVFVPNVELVGKVNPQLSPWIRCHFDFSDNSPRGSLFCAGGPINVISPVLN